MRHQVSGMQPDLKQQQMQGAPVVPAGDAAVVPAQPSTLLERIKDSLEQTRQNVLEKSPAFVVNNSTNIIGVMDIAGEMMVLKAAGVNLVSPQHRGKPLYYLIDPPANLYKSVAMRASFGGQWSDLLKPSFYRESIQDLLDLNKASTKDLKRGRLINRWQARGMLFSLAGMTANAVVPQKPEDPEDTLQMGQLYRDNPVHYVATRIGQGLWPLGWGNHKTQFAGLTKPSRACVAF
jgi:hypothetical protein